MHMQSTTINPAPRFPVSQNVARTMSSRDIAELVEKRHDNVKRTIEALAERGVIAFPQTEEKPTAGRPVVEYVFAGEKGKRDSIVVVAQLCPEFTARLVDRWQELEGRTIGTIAVPQSLPEALRLAADLADQIAEQAPKLAALERLQGAAGTLCLTDAAKHLGITRHRLMAWLQQNRWMYRRAGSRPWIAYQPRIESGLAKNKVTVIGTNDEGDERCASQFRITAKGLALLAQKIEGGLL